MRNLFSYLEKKSLFALCHADKLHHKFRHYIYILFTYRHEGSAFLQSNKNFCFLVLSMSKSEISLIMICILLLSCLTFRISEAMKKADKHIRTPGKNK